jgi:phosphoglycerate kinase
VTKPPKTIEDVDVRARRVLLRVDFNVPVDEESGAISDDSRIRAALPTINYLRDRGATIILCAHFGRPRGKVVDAMRLAPARRRLEELLGVPVVDADGPAGDRPRSCIEQLPQGGIAMLENLRFDPREEKNDPSFARELASLADLYVNDAFGAAHRAHASTAGVAGFLPAVAGLLMERELEMLGKALHSPERPVVAVIGGSKVSDKIAVLQHLGARVNTILTGGGMVAAFLKSKNLSGGRVEVTEE